MMKQHRWYSLKRIQGALFENLVREKHYDLNEMTFHVLQSYTSIITLPRTRVSDCEVPILSQKITKLYQLNMRSRIANGLPISWGWPIIIICLALNF